MSSIDRPFDWESSSVFSELGIRHAATTQSFSTTLTGFDAQNGGGSKEPYVGKRPPVIS